LLHLWLLGFTLISGWLVLASMAFAQTQGVAERMDAYLRQLERAGQFSGAVLVARNGQVLLRQGYGFADPERHLPFTPDTPHRVASISKMITAMAVLQLRDAGKLRLTDSICTHLNDCPKAWQPVTVKHLLRHTSGIADYEEALGLYSQAYLDFMTQPGATARIVREAKNKKLGFVPGSQFRYCNTSYILLGLIIERVSGRAFNDVIRGVVLEPAGMKHSGMIARPEQPANLSVGTSSKGAVRARIPDLMLEPPAADAALVSTLDDLYRWSQAMDGSALVSTQLAREVFSKGLGGYGFGWFVDRRFNRTRYVHTGELPGYRTVFIKFPRDRVTIVVFANDDQSPSETISKELSRLVLP
jgi:CubicO group peptidase (beta-lactamase class C family)